MAPASTDIDLLASQLPNPFTPMAFLPPDLAFQLTVASYVLVGALVGQIWDMLNTLSIDYKMFTRFRIGLPGIVYVISRFSTLAYLLYSTIFETAPIDNCTKLSKIGPWLFVIAHPSTALLFFFRIRAMYHDKKVVIVFFFLMWLAVVGGSATSIPGISGLNIGTTKYCINGKLEPYVSAGAIVPMVYDSFVFIAISWRLMQFSTGTEDPTLKEGAKMMIFGHNLSAFPKAMLQDGQAYYL
ncbi:hypothetical protein BDZ97DRAFT_1812262 [Flammula alnicola]|nr:hypothetical protein BDZ97DRAFT_1812262 [Flammula alnicola]